MDVYARMLELGIELNAPPAKGGIYSPIVEFGDKLVYVSGNNCKVNGTILHPGKVGAEVTLEQGQQAARQCMLNILSNLEKNIGDLNKIRRFVKILGFVASSSDFYLQAEVMNGASQLLLDIFGEKVGLAARSAIGVNVLPNNMPVEVEVLVELKVKSRMLV